MQGRSERFRSRLVIGVSALAMLVAVALPSLATLPGSTFESGDGNLAVDTPGNFDWANPIETITCGSTVPGFGQNCGTDLKKSTSDNAFGQGAKEDIPNPTVVSGSIPPNKSDLTRFYVNKERRGGSDFLYLAWERSNVLGTANMDFEFNQNSCFPNATPPSTNCDGNGVTPTRTAGDLLIRFDFTNGGGTPVLSLVRWLTTASGASASDCFKNNALPCWGVTNSQTSNVGGDLLDGVDDEQINLTLAGFAEGAVNTTTLTDNRPPGNPITLPALTFGEAGINLTAANVFPQTTCAHFGSAFLKSRSSAAFDAEMKDFIAPIPVNISNCGEIKIIKRTNPRGVDQAFNFTSTIPGTSKCVTDTTPDAFSLNDKGNTTTDSAGNTEDCTDVLAGSYTVTEAATAGFELQSLTCTVAGSGGSTGAQDGTNPNQANIAVKPGDTVTCVFRNRQLLGAIKITKTSTKGNAPLKGATFSIKQGGAGIGGSPFTTDDNGVVCVDNLGFGSYSVKEESAPPGYQINDTTTHTVTVDNNAACSDASFAGEALSFSDTPLSEIEVKFTSLAGAGVTKASMVCAKGATTVDAKSENGNADPAFDDTDETFTNLDPGTYTCTVVVDP